MLKRAIIALKDAKWKKITDKKIMNEKTKDRNLIKEKKGTIKK